MFTVLLAIHSAQLLPPNRGDLTIAQFVGNYNYYAAYFGVDFGSEYLNENGEWAQKEPDGTVYINIGSEKQPEYHFVVENGYVTGFSFEVEIKGNQGFIASYDTQMILSCLAFAGAQNEMRLFSNLPNQIAEEINDYGFRNFQFIKAGIEAACDTDYSGYIDANPDYLFPEEDAAEYDYYLSFVMNKRERE